MCLSATSSLCFDCARVLCCDVLCYSQLNMGEGKTRVILPMLALHWADGSRVVRLNFLPALIDEAYAHLHLVLTASSLLHRKLFRMPFHRDVQLTEQGIAAMRATLNYCQQVKCSTQQKETLECPGHSAPSAPHQRPNRHVSHLPC